MRFEDLSAEDQKLVKMNFGGEIEKQAAAQAGIITEMYNEGFSKIASEIADALDESEKVAAQAAGENYDEEFEKQAQELGSFIEEGVFDGLQKLGQERHGDPMHYLMPYVEEKVAEAGRAAALKAFASRMGAGAKGMAGKAGTKAVEFGKGVGRNFQQAATGKPVGTVGSPVVSHSALRPLSGKERAMEGAKGVGKVVGVGAGAYGASKLVGGKKEEK